VFARTRGKSLALGIADVRTNRQDEILTTDESLPSGVDPQVAADSFRLSPDGRRVAIKGTSGLRIYSLDGGGARLVPGAYPDYTLIGWTAEGRALYVYRMGDVPVVISRLEIEGGGLRPFTTLGPVDRAGLWRLHPVRLTPDGRGHAYTASHFLSDLYLIEGIR
jgi:hypothetical protein